jgi:hypothetical protein
MSHVRTQVRDLVAEALREIPDMRDAVFASRVNPIALKALPAIMVFTAEEAIETATMGFPRTQLRTLTLFVDVIIALREDYDDELDAFQVEVETILGGATFLADYTAANVQNLTLVSAEKSMNGEGETTTCATRMGYRVEFVTLENDPETLI